MPNQIAANTSCFHIVSASVGLSTDKCQEIKLNTKRKHIILKQQEKIKD